MSRRARGQRAWPPAIGLVAVLVGTLVAVLALACAPVEARRSGPHPSRAHRLRNAAAQTLPPQGIFEDCSLDSMLATCTQRLSAMHQAGLKVVVVAPGATSLDGLTSYSQAAQGLGMSVLWELSNPVWWREPPSGTGAAGNFSGFAAACGCQSNQDVLAYAINWLAALPATYGYYAVDDSMLAPGDRAGVSAYVAQIKQHDSAHPVMIGAFQASQGRQYVDIADLVGQEVYPITTDHLLPAAQHPGMWSYIDGTVTGAQQAARQAGKGSAFILQAFTWGDNLDDGTAIGVCSQADSTASCNGRLRYPSGAEQVALRNAVLAHAHPNLILWWSFQGTAGLPAPDGYFAPISPDVAAARWTGLSAAITAPMASQGGPRATKIRALRQRQLRAQRRRRARLRHHTRG
jgi:hypothetical protein